MKSFKHRTGFKIAIGLLAVGAGWFPATVALAYPPAPNVMIYGLIKDELGTPLTDPTAQVILRNSAGVQVSGTIQPGLAIGVNYALQVPMDSALKSGLWSPKAQVANNQYKLYVAVGGSTNLPIEMVGPYSVMGKPATQSQQNLTLGADSNGDGIPDEWETLFLQSLGLNLNLSGIDPNADYAHDGRTLRQEYLLGNYPFNPADNFKLSIVSQNAGSAVLSFTTMTGRSYTAYGSPDLQNWVPVAFSVPAESASTVKSYYAADIRPLQIQTVQPTNASTMNFFRVQLQ